MRCELVAPLLIWIKEFRRALLLQHDLIETKKGWGRRVNCKPSSAVAFFSFARHSVVAVSNKSDRESSEIENHSRIAQQFRQQMMPSFIYAKGWKVLSSRELPSFQWILMLSRSAEHFRWRLSDAKFTLYDIWSPCRSKCEGAGERQKTSVEWKPLFRLNWFFWCSALVACFLKAAGREEFYEARRRVVKHNFPGKTNPKSNLSAGQEGEAAVEW
jgi:hypothetical protein